MSDERPDDGIPIGEESFEEPKFTEPVPRRKDMPPAANAGAEISVGLIVFLVVAVLLVVFAVQNATEDVAIRFLAWEVRYPLALVIAGVVAVTVILDQILGFVMRRRRRRRIAEKQELRRLREQSR